MLFSQCDNKYECTTDQELADAVVYAKGRCYIMHLLGGSSFLHEMTSWLPHWKYDLISEIWLDNRWAFT